MSKRDDINVSAWMMILILAGSIGLSAGSFKQFLGAVVVFVIIAAALKILREVAEEPLTKRRMQA